MNHVRKWREMESNFSFSLSFLTYNIHHIDFVSLPNDKIIHPIVRVIRIILGGDGYLTKEHRKHNHLSLIAHTHKKKVIFKQLMDESFSGTFDSH